MPSWLLFLNYQIKHSDWDVTNLFSKDLLHIMKYPDAILSVIISEFWNDVILWSLLPLLGHLQNLDEVTALYLLNPRNYGKEHYQLVIYIHIESLSGAINVYPTFPAILSNLCN